MIIQNFNDNSIMVRHETVIDEDNLFSSVRLEQLNEGRDFEDYQDFNDEQLLFDDFIKKKLEQEEISVQIFEIVNKKLIGDFFSPIRIWEDNLLWNEWFDKFKSNHEICLYFYIPQENKTKLSNGNIHSDFSLNIYFEKNEKNPLNEFFKLEKKEYDINNNAITGNFEIELNSDVILKYLKQSNHRLCQNLIKEFNYQKLNQKLPEQQINQSKKLKI